MYRHDPGLLLEHVHAHARIRTRHLPAKRRDTSQARLGLRGGGGEDTEATGYDWDEYTALHLNICIGASINSGGGEFCSHKRIRQVYQADTFHVAFQINHVWASNFCPGDIRKRSLIIKLPSMKYLRTDCVGKLAYAQPRAMAQKWKSGKVVGTGFGRKGQSCRMIKAEFPCSVVTDGPPCSKGWRRF